MTRIRICRENGCDNAATTGGYCRLHYLKHWRHIKAEQQQNASRKLNRYIERICRENPEDYVDVIKRNLSREHFEQSLDEQPGFEDEGMTFDDLPQDDDIDELIRKLKIEKGY